MKLEDIKLWLHATYGEEMAHELIRHADDSKMYLYNDYKVPVLKPFKLIHHVMVTSEELTMVFNDKTQKTYPVVDKIDLANAFWVLYPYLLTSECIINKLKEEKKEVERGTWLLRNRDIEQDIKSFLKTRRIDWTMSLSDWGRMSRFVELMSFELVYKDLKLVLKFVDSYSIHMTERSINNCIDAFLDGYNTDKHQTIKTTEMLGEFLTSSVPSLQEMDKIQEEKAEKAAIAQRHASETATMKKAVHAISAKLDDLIDPCLSSVLQRFTDAGALRICEQRSEAIQEIKEKLTTLVMDRIGVLIK